MEEREWEYYIPGRLCTTKYIEEPHLVSSIWQKQEKEVLRIADAV